MGSLGSSPSVPTPQTTFLPQTVVTQTTAASPAAVDNSAGQQDIDERVSQARSASLLGRERGRFGTIRTGFRGLLGLTNNDRPKKTLLGE